YSLSGVAPLPQKAIPPGMGVRFEAETFDFTTLVPLLVPSLCQRLSDSAKKSWLAASVSNLGLPPLAPGLVSRTRRVPLEVPSHVHNSTPVWPSVAEK